MRVSSFLLLPFFAWTIAPGAFAATPVDMDGLIAAARSAPAEFSADALIRIADLEQLPKERRIELLKQAFERASGAQQRYKRHAASMRTDGSASYWNRVYSQDLDGLSLRLRAVESMLPLDKTKARELFAEIPALDTPPVKCEEFQVYDVGRFYDVLGILAQQSFDEKEIEAAQPFKLLQRYAGTLNSPVQAAPLAHVLAGAKVKDDDFKALVGAYGAALGKVSGDDRSFAYSLTLGKEILALVDECKRRHVSALPLLEGYRLYLVINLSAIRCADDDLMQGGAPSFGVFSTAPEEPSGDYVGFFNSKLQMAPLQTIQETEATPSRLEGVATGLRMCQDADCRDVVSQFRELVLTPGGTPYLPTEREKPEWQEKFRAALKALAEWKESSETTPAEYFREKCAAYGNLLNLVLNSPANREPALHAILDFVNGNRFQTANRLEWFLAVNGLAGRVGLDPAGLGNFATELRKASDPVIALYANLEAVAPRSAARILPLL